MTALRAGALVLCVAAHAQTLTPSVRALLAAGDYNNARKVLTDYKRKAGANPEYLEALSWINRTDLARKQYAQAETSAADVYNQCVQMAKRRPVDSDPHLATALGASIEVRAQAAAAQGRRDEAVSFLRGEVARWRETSIRSRVQKNLNRLDLEGKPALPLEISAGLTKTPARSLSAHKGHPVLLFFWAHWCSDCKQEIAVIERVQKAFGPKGLVVVAPTRHYGYVAGGTEAARPVETAYIRQIHSLHYGRLGPVEIPVSEENFARYGVSTTPTLALIDAAGVVRMYHPGLITYEELSRRVEAVTKR